MDGGEERTLREGGEVGGIQGIYIFTEMGVVVGGGESGVTG